MTPAPAVSNAVILKYFLGMTAIVAGAIFAAASVRTPSSTTTTALPFEMRPVVLSDGQALMVQTFELRISDWNQCHAAGGCALQLSAPVGEDEADYPATGLSYLDAKEYLGWVNATTGQSLRLPTADEWYAMAVEVLPETPDPLFTDPSLTWASTYLAEGGQQSRRLQPSGSFAKTADGIRDLNGNVWEWTQDCYSSSTGESFSEDRCPAFVMGGEHEAVMSFLIRDPARGGCAVGSPPAHLGLRLVSDDMDISKG